MKRRKEVRGKKNKPNDLRGTNLKEGGGRNTGEISLRRNKSQPDREEKGKKESGAGEGAYP